MKKRVKFTKIGTLWFALGSILLHTLLLSFYSLFVKDHEELNKNSPVKVSVVKMTNDPNRIPLEQKLRETKKPENSIFEGEQNHQAAKNKIAPHSPGDTPGYAQSKKKNEKKSTASRIYETLLPSKNDLQEDGSFNDLILVQPNSNQTDVSTQKTAHNKYWGQIRRQIEFFFSQPLDFFRSKEAQNQLKNAGYISFKGDTTIFFIIEENGDLKKIEIIESSGNTILDQSIVQAIRNAAPFNPKPSAYNLHEYHRAVTVPWSILVKARSNFRQF